MKKSDNEKLWNEYFIISQLNSLANICVKKLQSRITG